MPGGLRRGYLQTRTAARAEDTVPARPRPALETVLVEIRSPGTKAEAIRTGLTRLAARVPAARLLQTAPGVGVLTATALVAFVGDIHRFRSRRHFAACLGLTGPSVPKKTNGRGVSACCGR